MSAVVKKRLLGDEIFTLSHFLSPEECSASIDWGESLGFEPATVDAAGGHQYLPDWRNNTRLMTDDHERAEWLWSKASRFIPGPLQGKLPVGINERLRIYRYDPGQQFDWHTDGYFQRSNGERSRLTFMVYLNGGFEGGETSFGDETGLSEDRSLLVTPETGLALFFVHHLPHKGEPVTRGRKYVLRTDVMYGAD